MTIKLPETLKIGHKVYTIEAKDLTWLRETQSYGSCDAHADVINVVIEDVTDVNIVNTLIHEALHALFREYDLTEDNEEHIVTVLANGLCQIVRDNPTFCKVVSNLKE